MKGRVRRGGGGADTDLAGSAARCWECDCDNVLGFPPNHVMPAHTEVESAVHLEGSSGRLCWVLVGQVGDVSEAFLVVE